MITCISLILLLVYPTIHTKMLLLTNKGTFVMSLLFPDPMLCRKWCGGTLGSDERTNFRGKPEAVLGNTK